MSTSAPFATADGSKGDDSHHGGRRKYDTQNQRQDAPFATNYPDTVDGETPKKQHGRRRYADQDAKHDAPFATSAGEIMFDSPKHNQDEYVPVQEPESAAGRQQPIKPSDNAGVFRHDAEPEGDTPSRGGRRRFKQEQHDAPFATMGDDSRNGNNPSGNVETPRSAGGRRRYEDKLQKQPAPFAVDGDDRFRDAPARNNSNGTSAANIAGARKTDRHVPPPNSTGEGQKNASHMRDCPFALN